MYQYVLCAMSLAYEWVNSWVESDSQQEGSNKVLQVWGLCNMANKSQPQQHWILWQQAECVLS